jgi:hypothetical protein
MVADEMKGWLAHEQERRRAIRWLVLSIIIHLPFTPLGPLFGLLIFVTRPKQPTAPIEELNGIPVELLEQPKLSDQNKTDIEPTSKAQQTAEAAITTLKKPISKRSKVAPAALDAGFPEDSGTEEQPVAELDAATADRTVAMNLDAGADASTIVVQAPTSSSEVALAAATRGIADSNANIRVNLFMDRVRQQPLGANLGQLLKSVYQWRDFFSPAGLDPVRDFDHILVFGPQLRDSSQVAAFLQHNVRASRMRGAIDSLIRHSGPGSTWLRSSKMPAARAVADRAQRLFVMYPGQVVAVVPPSVEKDALALTAFKLPAAKGDELASITVKTPWRALLGTRFQLSKTIRSAVIQVYPEADGGARVEVVLDDESVVAAQEDAKQIKRDIDAVTLASNWLLSGSRFAEPLQVRVEVKEISAVLRVTRPQAERILRIAEVWLTPEGRRSAHEVQGSAPPDAGNQALAKTAAAQASAIRDGGITGLSSPSVSSSASPP